MFYQKPTPNPTRLHHDQQTAHALESAAAYSSYPSMAGKLVQPYIPENKTRRPHMRLAFPKNVYVAAERRDNIPGLFALSIRSRNDLQNVVIVRRLLMLHSFCRLFLDTAANARARRRHACHILRRVHTLNTRNALARMNVTWKSRRVDVGSDGSRRIASTHSAF